MVGNITDYSKIAAVAKRYEDLSSALEYVRCSSENRQSVAAARALVCALLTTEEARGIKISAGGKDLLEYRDEIFAKIIAGDESDPVYQEAVEFLRAGNTRVSDTHDRIAAFVDSKTRELLMHNGDSLAITSGRLSIHIIEGPNGRSEVSVSFPGTVEQVAAADGELENLVEILKKLPGANIAEEGGHRTLAFDSFNIGLPDEGVFQNGIRVKVVDDSPGNRRVILDSDLIAELQECHAMGILAESGTTTPATVEENTPATAAHTPPVFTPASHATAMDKSVPAGTNLPLEDVLLNRISGHGEYFKAVGRGGGNFFALSEKAAAFEVQELGQYAIMLHNTLRLNFLRNQIHALSNTDAYANYEIDVNRGKDFPNDEVNFSADLRLAKAACDVMQALANEVSTPLGLHKKPIDSLRGGFDELLEEFDGDVAGDFQTDADRRRAYGAKMLVSLAKFEDTLATSAGIISGRPDLKLCCDTIAKEIGYLRGRFAAYTLPHELLLESVPVEIDGVFEAVKTIASKESEYRAKLDEIANDRLAKRLGLVDDLRSLMGDLGELKNENATVLYQANALVKKLQDSRVAAKKSKDSTGAATQAADQSVSPAMTADERVKQLTETVRRAAGETAAAIDATAKLPPLDTIAASTAIRQMEELHRKATGAQEKSEDLSERIGKAHSEIQRCSAAINAYESEIKGAAYGVAGCIAAVQLECIEADGKLDDELTELFNQLQNALGDISAESEADAMEAFGKTVAEIDEAFKKVHEGILAARTTRPGTTNHISLLARKLLGKNPLGIDPITPETIPQNPTLGSALQYACEMFKLDCGHADYIANQGGKLLTLGNMAQCLVKFPADELAILTGTNPDSLVETRGKIYEWLAAQRDNLTADGKHFLAVLRGAMTAQYAQLMEMARQIDGVDGEQVDKAAMRAIIENGSIHLDIKKRNFAEVFTQFILKNGGDGSGLTRENLLPYTEALFDCISNELMRKLEIPSGSPYNTGDGTGNGSGSGTEKKPGQVADDPNDIGTMNVSPTSFSHSSSTLAQVSAGDQDHVAFLERRYKDAVRELGEVVEMAEGFKAERDALREELERLRVEMDGLCAKMDRLAARKPLKAVDGGPEYIIPKTPELGEMIDLSKFKKNRPKK
jgi:predicted  nucleic acid-binding Zn-ribbon protein